jgi:hypothetical protein
MNSFSLESRMVFRLEELTKIYYDTLVSLKPDIESEYLFDLLLADIKIIFLNGWIQYLGFSLGMLDGYTDPAQADTKETWRLMMIRNMQMMNLRVTLDHALQATTAEHTVGLLVLSILITTFLYLTCAPPPPPKK